LGFAGFILLATKRGKQKAKNNNHDLFQFFLFLFMLDSFAYCESIDEFLGLHSLIEICFRNTYMCAWHWQCACLLCACKSIHVGRKK
jgi:hypothetical protein